jgi:hypothetical protein
LNCTASDKVLGPKHQLEGGQEDEEDEVSNELFTDVPFGTAAALPDEAFLAGPTGVNNLGYESSVTFDFHAALSEADFGSRTLSPPATGSAPQQAPAPQPATSGPTPSLIEITDRAIGHVFGDEDPDWCDICGRYCGWPYCGWPFRRIADPGMERYEEKKPRPPGWTIGSSGLLGSSQEPNNFITPSPLSDTMQTISNAVTDIWSKLDSANKTLIGIGPTIDTVEGLIPRLLGLTGDSPMLQITVTHFIHSFRKLGIRSAWKGLGDVWTRFSSKMNFLRSGVDILSSKFACSLKVS